jgi:hypothetical protein
VAFETLAAAATSLTVVSRRPFAESIAIDAPGRKVLTDVSSAEYCPRNALRPVSIYDIETGLNKSSRLSRFGASRFPHHPLHRTPTEQELP